MEGLRTRGSEGCLGRHGQRLEHLGHQGRIIDRLHPKCVTRLVGEARVGQIDLDVSGVLGRASAIQTTGHP